MDNKKEELGKEENVVSFNFSDEDSQAEEVSFLSGPIRSFDDDFPDIEDEKKSSEKSKDEVKNKREPVNNRQPVGAAVRSGALPIRDEAPAGKKPEAEKAAEVE